MLELEAGRIRLGRLAGVPQGGSFEWFDRHGPVEVDDRVELVSEPCMKRQRYCSAAVRACARMTLRMVALTDGTIPFRVRR